MILNVRYSKTTSYFIAYPKIKTLSRTKTFDIARKNLTARGFFGKGMIGNQWKK